MNFLKRRDALLDPLHVINNAFHKHRFIFIHVPKCAGSSISLNLLGYQVGHTPYKTYEALLGKDLRHYFTFSIVRDPLIRFWSAYNFIEKGGITSDDKVYQSNLGTPNDVLRGLAQGRRYTIHFDTQCKFLQSRQEYLTLNYIHKIENDIDSLIRIIAENTDDHLATRIKSALSTESKRNVANKHPQGDTDLDLDLLFRVYEDDFWRLGYNPPDI